MLIEASQILGSGKYSCVVTYFKAGKWRIYRGATYSVKSEKDRKSLIEEVGSEKHVSKNKIKIMKPYSIILEEIFYEK